MSSKASKGGAAQGSASSSGGAQPLIIRQQPVAKFYKEEGGLSNQLIFSVESPIKLEEKVPLAITLELDNGQNVVEDLHCDSRYELTNAGPTIINFRINKVSQRRDGHKFRLRVDMDKASATTSAVAKYAGQLQGVVSADIEVLSKRKAHERRALEAAAAAGGGASSASAGGGGVVFARNAPVGSSSAASVAGSDAGAVAAAAAGFTGVAPSASTAVIAGGGASVALAEELLVNLKLVHGRLGQLNEVRC